MSISRVDLLSCPPRAFRPPSESESESDFRAVLDLAQGTASAKTKAIPPGPPQPFGRQAPTFRPEFRVSPEFGGPPVHAQGTNAGKNKAIPPGPPHSLGGQILPSSFAFQDLFEAFQVNDLVGAREAFNRLQAETLSRLSHFPGLLDPQGGRLESFNQDLAGLGRALQAGNLAAAQDAYTTLLEKYPKAYLNENTGPESNPPGHTT